MTKFIQPAARGSISEAIVSNSLTKVAPESPRPLEMLDAVEITSTDILTADDAALHELLISAAYEADKGMSNQFTSLPVLTALKFLGQHARRDALTISLSRLMSTTVSYGSKKTRRFENVPLLFSWLESTENEDVIRYSLPEPIRILMREMPAYAYLELAPISQMKSKYSVRLYRVLAAAAAREKWVPRGENKVVVSGTLEDLYRWTGFPLENDTMKFGKFRQRVLKDLVSELSTVRRFSVRIDEIRKEARGRPLERIDFILNLRAPSHTLTTVSFKPGEHKERRIGGVDTDQYRVNSMIWIKAQNAFWRVQKRPQDYYFKAWQVALHEALDEAPVSPGYTQRAYRGRRLLNAIASLGTDEAAFKFCAEEVDLPDLLEAASPDLTVDATEAENARKARIEERNHVRTSKTSFNGECNDRSVALTLKYGKHSFARPATKPAPAKIVTSAFEEAGVPEMSDVAAAMLEDLISDPVTNAPQEPDLGKDVTSLEGIREIIWTADRSLSVEELETEIWPAFQIETSGPYPIELTVRAWVDGCVTEFSFGTYNVSQSDIEAITKNIGVNIDDELNELEYLK